MNTTILCTIAGEKISVTNNAVKCASSSIQIELVKRLIECKSKTKVNESALPLFYNKYLRHYPISEVQFLSNDEKNFILIENWEMAAAA